MASFDIFNDDAFNVQSLTAAITSEPDQVIPNTMQELFTEEGITTSNFSIEKRGNALKLVASAPRGAEGTRQKRDRPELVPFATNHLPEYGEVFADEIQNVRAFGSETEVEQVMGLVNRELAKMRSALEATIEYQRINAIKGRILDSDGSTVLLDLFQRFGITQNQLGVDTTATSFDMKVAFGKAMRSSSRAAPGLRVRGWRMLCGDGVFDGLLGNKDIKAAYERYRAGEFLRNDPRMAFPFGNVLVENYYGSVDGIDFLADDEAYLVPVADGLCVTKFAPADYIETVNTVGLPYYAQQEVKEMRKGVNIEAQSNPGNIITQPRAVVKVNFTF